MARSMEVVETYSDHHGLHELVALNLDTGTRLIVAAGSIIDFGGDAIVNAANEGCTGGFGVDEMINRAGGFALKEARKQLHGCRTGEAKVTQSYGHTKVKWIIHAVGPVYRLPLGMAAESSEAEEYLVKKDPLLVAAYESALQKAKELGVESIGFTLLSAGVLRGARSLEAVLEIGLDAAVRFAYQGLRDLVMVAYTCDEQRILTDLAGRRVDRSRAV